MIERFELVITDIPVHVSSHEDLTSDSQSPLSAESRFATCALAPRVALHRHEGYDAH